MPGMFIDVEVDAKVAGDPKAANKLAEVCPVSIFEAGNGKLRIVEENLDECVLCDLCIEAAPPGAVRVIKLYDQ
jgi:NAD-dependent dihydropyrimidine dehydrogenase PreA subunit